MVGYNKIDMLYKLISYCLICIRLALFFFRQGKLSNFLLEFGFMLNVIFICLIFFTQDKVLETFSRMPFFQKCFYIIKILILGIGFDINAQMIPFVNDINQRGMINTGGITVDFETQTKTNQADIEILMTGKFKEMIMLSEGKASLYTPKT